MTSTPSLSPNSHKHILIFRVKKVKILPFQRWPAWLQLLQNSRVTKNINAPWSYIININYFLFFIRILAYFSLQASVILVPKVLCSFIIISQAPTSSWLWHRFHPPPPLWPHSLSHLRDKVTGAIRVLVLMLLYRNCIFKRQQTALIHDLFSLVIQIQNASMHYFPDGLVSWLSVQPGLLVSSIFC